MSPRILSRRLAGSSLASLVIYLLFFLPGLSVAAPGRNDGLQSFKGSMRVDCGAVIGNANPLILGNNLQWVDNGDGIVDPENLFFDPGRLQLIEKMKPTILRYPGGTLSDSYHWRDGIGPLSSRKKNRDLVNREKRIVLGTDEFLKLTEKLEAEAVITLNVPSGSVEEAVSWLEYVNGMDRSPSGKIRARYWEIGNEPYLLEKDRPDLALSPEKFADRVNKIVPALLARDPRIKVGIPLRSDFIGGIAATPVRGFNDKVLGNLKAPVDFVALHNAYLPFANQRPGSDEEMYWAAMAATSVVEEDFAATRAMLRKYGLGDRVKLAVTEYNAMFTLHKGKTDAYLASLAGAIYVADAIRLFAYTPDLLFANFWSLAGNWHFGALDQKGNPRPAYNVLTAYRKILHGSLLKVETTSPTFDTIAVGAVPAQKNVPLLTSLATRDQQGLSLVIINKSLRQAGEVTVSISDNNKFTKATCSEITGDSPLAGVQDGRNFWLREKELEIRDNQLTVKTPPYSMTVITMPYSDGPHGDKKEANAQ